MRNYISVSTPKPYRNRAQALFQSIEPHIKFNDRGEIYDVNAKIIEHSRLEDLIQHAVRDRRRNMLPIGWSEFVDVLRQHNIPKSMLNHETINELSIKPTKVITPPIRQSRARKRESPALRKLQSLSPKRKRSRRKSRRYPSVDFLKTF